MDSPTSNTNEKNSTPPSPQEPKVPYPIFYRGRSVGDIKGKYQYPDFTILKKMLISVKP